MLQVIDFKAEAGVHSGKPAQLKSYRRQGITTFLTLERNSQ